MLNRRFFRIKVLQSLYAWFQSEDNDLVPVEKELFKSVNKVEELYLLMLLLVVDVMDSARNLIETKKEKILATQEDLNPNLHFVENKAFRLLEDNVAFKRAIDTRKLSWGIHSDNVRKLYRQIEASRLYEEYMTKEEDTFKNDRAFLVKVYERFFVDNEIFEQLVEEQSIFWPVDLELVHLNIIKTLQRLKASQDVNSKVLLDLYRDQEDDTKFVKNLLRKTLSSNEEYSELIASQTRNWEVDRLAKLDIILMKMALCEIDHMPTIPVKVTLNEYIDLSKYFSTPKSKGFINGVLDKIVNSWKAEGRIVKQGRGLVE
ncbi:transcription antitermination factor NusB [bacterium SCSIO 12741]|nr:transcription antitermination factor NusB [bacterium SCSIO 12741]